jgi:hypothetical protein
MTKVRSSRQTYHHDDLRRALIDAALTPVTDKQEWGFTFREAARRTGAVAMRHTISSPRSTAARRP